MSGTDRHIQIRMITQVFSISTDIQFSASQYKTIVGFVNSCILQKKKKKKKKINK